MLSLSAVFEREIEQLLRRLPAIAGQQRLLDGRFGDLVAQAVAAQQKDVTIEDFDHLAIDRYRFLGAERTCDEIRRRKVQRVVGVCERAGTELLRPALWSRVSCLSRPLRQR